MPGSITRKEAEGLMTRLRLLGSEVSRERSSDEAIAELSALMADAYALGWVEEMRRADEKVRALWVRLKTHGS